MTRGVVSFMVSPNGHRMYTPCQSAKEHYLLSPTHKGSLPHLTLFTLLPGLKTRQTGTSRQTAKKTRGSFPITVPTMAEIHIVVSQNKGTPI